MTDTQPAGWKALYRRGEAWVEVGEPTQYGRQPDAYNRCEFRAVETTALRLEVSLRPDFSAGVHEWRVE